MMTAEPTPLSAEELAIYARQTPLSRPEDVMIARLLATIYALTDQVAALKAEVVYEHDVDEIGFIQGPQEPNELLSPVTAERLRQIERCAYTEGKQTGSYEAKKEWEGRAVAAEAERDALTDKGREALTGEQP